MNGRRHEIISGIGALLALLTVIVGVPLVLVSFVGSPLPTMLPSLHHLGRVLARGDVTSATLIKAFSLAVWIAWAQATATTLSETVAVIRGRRARRVPGPPALRLGIANLVTSVALLVSGPIRPAIALSDGPPDLRTAIAQAELRHEAPSGEHEQTPDSEAVADDRGARVQEAVATTRGPTWTVGPRDTLWDIAERTLGDGLRWREIHALNADRQQPDGGSVRPDDDFIAPGWTLELPADAALHQPDEQPAADDADVTAASAPFVTVDPNDTLWDLSEEHLEDPHRWPELYETNRGIQQEDGRRLVDPDLIQPGWVLRLPDGDAPADLIPQEVEETATPEREVPRALEDRLLSPGTTLGNADGSRVSEPRQGESRSDHQEVEAEPSDQAAQVAGAGIAAAGLLLTLDRIRRARRRRRPAGRRLSLPEGDVRETEHHVRAMADLDGVEDLEISLSSLAGHVTRHGHRLLDRVALVSTSGSEITVHLTEPELTAPEGWRIEDHGMTWVSRSRISVRSSDLDPSERPLLVSVGATAEGDRRVHVNVRCVSMLRIKAGDEARRTTLLSFATELATSTIAPHVRVVLAGIGGTLTALERIESVPETRQAVEILEARARELEPADADARDVQRVVLLLMEPPSSEVLDRIGSLVDACRGTAAVVASSSEPIEDAWTLAETDAGWRLLPAGLDLDPLEFDPGELEDLGELIGQAKDSDYVDPDPGPDITDREDDGPAMLDDVIDITDDVPAPVEVRLLGPVHVSGVERWPTSKSMELVVYLATHQNGADSDALMEALWPREEPNRNRLQTEVSRARKVLGEAPDGRPYLPPAQHDVYRLHPSVRTDHDRFRELRRRADNEPQRTVELLEAALELVDGRPMSALPSDYWWASLDVHAVEQDVADVAHRLAALYLDRDEPEAAARTARLGLEADPLFEVLHRDLMRAEAAMGNTAEIHLIMQRFRDALAKEADGNDADDWMDPETVALFERLVSRSEAHAGGTATMLRRKAAAE